MKRLLILTTLFLSATLLSAQDIAGDWSGKLSVGGAELRLILHVTKSASGSFKATLDSIDQGANGIPVDSVALKDSKLKLEVDAVHGEYEGTVSADANTITGTWSQGSSLPLEFKRGVAAPVKTEHKPAKPSDIDGAWSGVLDVNGQKLRIVFHITNTEDGLIATMDSPDQNAANLPTSSCTRDGSSLKIEAKAMGASFSGKISPDLSTMEGTWSQGGGSLPLTVKRDGAKPKASAAPEPHGDLDGPWIGTLDTGAVKLRLVFRIKTQDGVTTATLDSVDQGANGIHVDSVTRDGSSLKMSIDKVSGSFDGTIAADHSSIDGTWKQGSGSLPLVLKPLKDEASLIARHPQNPVKPYPYRDEDVTYENKVESVTLAATLTLPQGKGPFPGVVLITGSGPQDRDETLLGHKPFLVLSDYLTRHGIAVLRADDRGVGKSTGIFAKGTTADFATDAEAGVAYLKTRSEIDPHKIGLIGHSEGGIIAPMIAARNKDIAFIVMMAGTGVPGDEVLPAQSEAIAVATGAKPEDAAKDAAKEKEMIKLVETEKDEATLKKELKEKMVDEPDGKVGMVMNQLNSVWFRYFLTYDPAPALSKVTCPVLALNGSLDKQVLPDQNLPVIRKALAGNPHAEIDELPGLNHLFQTAKTGSPAEYAQIEETIAPVALDKMATWILKQ